MIYSLTISPCIDYNLDLEENDIRVGGVNRPVSKGFSLGGKGITVSRMLNNLKVKNIPLIAIGGDMGKRIKEVVDKEYKDAVYLSTEGNSRLNVMITGPHQDTRFDPAAPKVTEKGLDKMFSYFKKHLKKGDIIILSGSLGQEDKHLYAEIMENYANPVGADVFLDTVDEALSYALPCHPFMIKPNDEELGDLLGKTMTTDDDILKGGEELKAKGPRSVMVTMGRRGAYYFSEDGHIYHCSNAHGKQISAVGAGDSSIAGFIKGMAEKKTIEETLAYSMAAGGATAFSEHLGSYALWKSLVPQIEVTKIK
ncbi:MAG: 1-phosphofructokinase family hexose kinase [Bacilli bacterium]|jgi:1-phosphofructokinase|nr:1-phosphofructokinase family hexose kinase [Bacilli bacterium]